MRIILNMINNIRILIVVTALLLMTASAGQTDYYGQAQRTSLGDIRLEMKDLVAINKALETEYSLLTIEMSILEASIHKLREKMALVRQNSRDELQVRNKHNKSLTQLHDSYAYLQNDLTLHESQNAYWEGSLMDLDENERVWALMLADLKIQNREKTMNIKMLEYGRDEEINKAQEVVIKLKNTIARQLEEERELLHWIQKLTNEGSGYEIKAVDLKNDNQALLENRGYVEKKLGFKDREIAILKNKRLYAIRKSEAKLFRKEQEKSKIETIVKQLEKEYADMDQLVNASLLKQQQRRNFAESMKVLNKNNMDLHIEFSALKERIANLEQ